MMHFKILLLFVFSLFLCLNCQSHDPSVKDIAAYELDRPTKQIPITILITNEFNSEQTAAISLALHHWVVFSNNVLIIDPVFNWAPPKEFDETIYDDFEYITIWKKWYTDPSILNLQLNNKLTANGFSSGNFVVIVDRGDLTTDMTYRIFKHEFGHQLGMEHIYDKYPALMNLGGNYGAFTKYDKIMFCSLYKCE